jgi:hypothetical protein
MGLVMGLLIEWRRKFGIAACLLGWEFVTMRYPVLA